MLLAAASRQVLGAEPLLNAKSLPAHEGSSTPMQPVCLHAAQCAAAPDLCRLLLAGQRYAFAAATAAPAAAAMADTASMALGRRWYRPPAAVAISLAKPRLM